MPFCRVAFYLLVTFLGILPIACGKPDRIETYDIPKIAPPPKEITDSFPEYRLWGIIIPSGDSNSWFFKIHANAKTLAENEESLKKFKESISFPNGVKEKPVWVIPDGWKESRDNPDRLATLSFGPKDKSINLTISIAGGGALANINRWRGQAGVKPISASKMESFKLGGFDAYLVDVKGISEPVLPGKMGIGTK